MSERVNLGRVAYVEKGAFNSGTTYQKKDVVSFNGGSYVFIGDTPAANAPPTDEANWQPLIDPAAMNNKIAEADSAKEAALTAAENAHAKAQEAMEAASTATVAAAAADEARANIQSDLAQKAPAIYVDASGELVHITDGAAQPVRALITHIAPKQDGSGDPSPDNVRPISGWDEVSVNVASKNIFDVNSIELLATENNNNSTSLHFGIKLYGPQKYTVSCKEYGEQTYIYAKRIRADGSLGETGYIATPQVARSSTFELAENEGLILYDARAVFTKEASIESFIATKTQVEIGDTATAYEPYNGETLTASLPETVYGGKLDWTTGVLTVTQERFVFNGQESGWWKYTGGTGSGRTHGVFAFDYNKFALGYDTSKCSHFANVRAVYDASGKSGQYSDHLTVQRKYFGWGTVDSTVDEFKAWLAEQYAAGTPVTVVYKLAEPYTIQLTPQQLETLKGTNNIWSSAGKTAVTYAADTKMYIDNKIAAIAAVIV